MNHRFFLFGSQLLIAVLLAVASPPAQATDESAPTPHIVVIGEVQGAANTVADFLGHLGLIDAELHWTGGDTILIQTGDLVDDGENVRAALDLFMRLQREATAAGGRVIVLMGNHEALNILGVFRDVNYMAYQSFAGPDSEDRQRQAWEDWLAWRTRRAEALGGSFEADSETEAEWFALHPPGWIEYAESMRPDGVYGGWLRTLPVAIEIDEVLFIHAGINPEMEDMDVASINSRAAQEISSFDEYRDFMVTEGLSQPTSSVREMVNALQEEASFLNNLKASQRTTRNPRAARYLEIEDLGQLGTWSILDQQGPLWFRGAARFPEAELGPQMDAILEACDVERMVTGQSNGKEHHIHARFDNRVLLTSIAMSDDPYAGGGDPAALEIDKGDYFVVTLSGRELLIDN